MATPAIEVEDVYFAYPDGHEVLRGVSCQIDHGEKVAIIGPNGAGKSTFMSLLNGVLMPQKGRIFVHGITVDHANLLAVRRKIGMVFQDPDDQLFSPTVYEDVAFGPKNLGFPADRISIRVKEALRLVGLSGFEERSSFHLSFGEKKRLSLATVLSYEPEILVFDEPSTNMDPPSRRRLIQWLQASDRTILLSTHDLDTALEVCHRSILLSGGKIAADGPSVEILYNRALLERHRLELPMTIETHRLLQDILYVEDIDERERKIIAEFLSKSLYSLGPAESRRAGGEEIKDLPGGR